MGLLPRKITSRRQALWFALQIGLYAMLSAVVVTALIMEITGKVIPDIYGFSIIVPLVVAPPIGYWIANLIYEITLLGEEVKRIAYVDELTGIANRRAFFEQALDFVAQAKNTDEATSVILIDIDHFKNINDTYGHKTGDALLVLVADTLTRSIGENNGVVGRIGGEEFVVLVMDKNSSDALARADQIRLDIKNAAIEARNEHICVTASIGLAIHKPGEELDDTLIRADKALYLAKNAGRDRVASLMAVA